MRMIFLAGQMPARNGVRSALFLIRGGRFKSPLLDVFRLHGTAHLSMHTGGQRSF